MSKRIIVLFLIVLLLLFVKAAFSIQTFTYKETELVSLAPKAADPDAQNLIYTYSKPLDENGKWQTTYGDAGQYKATITVSDGELSTSQEVLIIVEKKEEAPVIESFTPTNDEITINEGKSIDFEISASDLNKDTLSYKWFVDDEEVSDESGIKYETDYEDAGKHNIKVVVSDNNSSVEKEWVVDVNDINIENILEQIKDVEIEETDTARLEMPDFKSLGLSYEISEPLGKDNIWKTGYEDAGNYKVTVKAQGRGFSGEKEVNIKVLNKDRAPKLEALKDITIKENEEAMVELRASDIDNDNIIFSAEGLPEGANFEGNIFEWKPDYDFVKKENAFDYVLDKFHILSKSIKIKFIASSNDLKDEKEVKITVEDTTRPFVLDKFEPIYINEGEEVKISPKYNHPDNNKVSFSYSGWMSSNTKKTGFDDAGTYIVKVTGTDGYYILSDFVIIVVRDVNRKPIFGKIKEIQVFENDTTEIELNANDADNNNIIFSAENLPKGSKVEGNLFTFKPDFDFVQNDEFKKITVKFVASDGKGSAEGNADIIVFNKNRAPKILNASKELNANVDKPFTMLVSAEDPDNDSLSYLWDFGLFEKYNATAVHKRVFTTKGSKKAKVIVSDGVNKATYEWDIKVV